MMLPENVSLNPLWTVAFFLRWLVVAWSLSAVSSNGELPRDTACRNAILPKGHFEPLVDFSYAYDLTNSNESGNNSNGLTGEETPFAGTYRYLTRLVADVESSNWVREACVKSRRPIFYEIWFNNKPHYFPQINHTRLINQTVLDELFPNITLAELAETYPDAIALTTHVQAQQIIKHRARWGRWTSVETDKFFISTVPLPRDLGSSCYNRTQPALNYVDSPLFPSFDWWLEGDAFRIKRLLVMCLMISTVMGPFFYLMLRNQFKVINTLEKYVTLEQIRDAQQKQAYFDQLNLTDKQQEQLENANATDAFRCAICFSLLGVRGDDLEIVLAARTAWFSCFARKESLNFPYPLSIQGNSARYHPACLMRFFQTRRPPINPVTNEPIDRGALQFVPNFRREAEAYLAQANTAM